MPKPVNNLLFLFCCSGEYFLFYNLLDGNHLGQNILFSFILSFHMLEQWQYPYLLPVLFSLSWSNYAENPIITIKQSDKNGKEQTSTHPFDLSTSDRLQNFKPLFINLKTQQLYVYITCKIPPPPSRRKQKCYSIVCCMVCYWNCNSVWIWLIQLINKIKNVSKSKPENDK